MTVATVIFDENGNYVSGGEKIILEMRLLGPTYERLSRTGLTMKSSFDVKPGKYLVRQVSRIGRGANGRAQRLGRHSRLRRAKWEAECEVTGTKFAIRALLAGATIWGVALNAPTQEAAKPATSAEQAVPTNTVISTESPVVLVDAVVTDKKGHYINQLTQSDSRYTKTTKSRS